MMGERLTCTREAGGDEENPPIAVRVAAVVELALGAAARAGVGGGPAGSGWGV